MKNQNATILESVPGAGKQKIKLSSIASFLGLAVAVVFFGLLTNGGIFEAKNLPILLSDIYSIGLGCAGVLFVMATGNLDLSLAGNIACSAAVAATLAGTQAAMVLPITLVFATLVGLANGVLFAILKIPSFIATLATSFILQGFSTVICQGFLPVPFELNVLDNTVLKLVVLAGVFIIAFVVFEFTSFGKQCRAVGALPEAARQSGVNVKKIRILTYVISGFMCGVIAFFLMVRSNSASNTTGTGMEFSVLLAMMLGGISLTGGWVVRFRSVVVGSLLMAIIANGMTVAGIGVFDQQLIEAVLFIIVVTVSFKRQPGMVIR